MLEGIMLEKITMLEKKKNSMMLYPLNVHSTTRQSYLNKTGKRPALENVQDKLLS